MFFSLLAISVYLFTVDIR